MSAKKGNLGNADECRGNTLPRRQVLMVAFHFPPIASSAGALRAQAFATYLPEHGWHPHMLAPVKRVYDAVEVNTPVAADVRVHRAWALDARRHLGWHGRYPSLLAIPDRWVSWTPAAVYQGLAAVRKFSIRAIWSTYPIPTSHLIAGLIAKRSGLPWIAEFRDPVQPSGGRIQRAVQRSLERYVVRHSDLLVFVTEGARRAAREKFPEAAGRMHVISNGYDTAVESCADIPQKSPRGVKPIVLVHSGHLYPDGRNPTTLLEAVARLKRAGRIDDQSLRIVLRNTQQDEWITPRIKELDIGDIVVLAPRLPHAEAMMEQREAHALLLLQGKEFNHQIPAKLFEYLRSRRPILALVHPMGDTALLLKELGAGLSVNPETVGDIADALLVLVTRLSDESEAEQIWPPDENRLRRYSRRRQTGDLAKLLDDAIRRDDFKSLL